MAIDQGEVYRAMATAYRQGVLDKSLSLFGEATARAMDQTGASMGDLINRMDEAEEETIRRLDNALSRSGPMLRVASNDKFMGIVSRVLDLQIVRTLAIKALARSMTRSISSSAVPSPPLSIGAATPGEAESSTGVGGGRDSNG